MQLASRLSSGTPSCRTVSRSLAAVARHKAYCAAGCSWDADVQVDFLQVPHPRVLAMAQSCDCDGSPAPAPRSASAWFRAGQAEQPGNLAVGACPEISVVKYSGRNNSHNPCFKLYLILRSIVNTKTRISVFRT